MKVYITTNCLNGGGIIEREVTTYQNYPNIVQWTEDGKAWSCSAIGENKQWHHTIESAKAKAEAMRLKRISTLKNQIAKLEALRF